MNAGEIFKFHDASFAAAIDDLFLLMHNNARSLTSRLIKILLKTNTMQLVEGITFSFASDLIEQLRNT